MVFIIDKEIILNSNSSIMHGTSLQNIVTFKALQWQKYWKKGQSNTKDREILLNNETYLVTFSVLLYMRQNQNGET